MTELRVQVGILGERVFGIDKNLGSRIEALSVPTPLTLPQKADKFPQVTPSWNRKPNSQPMPHAI